jgi:hypothetical protein
MALFHACLYKIFDLKAQPFGACLKRKATGSESDLPRAEQVGFIFQNKGGVP